MSDAFRRALRAVRSDEVPHAELGAVILDVMPVRGVSVATFGEPAGNETISATDPTAFRVDEIQFDLSEGPCWVAMRTAAPVLEEDVRGNPRHPWPAFFEAVREQPVGALFAFPITFGPFHLGAVDMYERTAATLDPEHVEHGTALATALGRRVLHRTIDSLGADAAAFDTGPFSRRVVHQATGVVLAQLDVTPDDAYLLIQGHAFARKAPMRDVAEDIINGRLRFENRGDLIEEVE